MEIELSETAQEQWDLLRPQTQETLLIEFEVAIDLTYLNEPDEPKPSKRRSTSKGN